MSPDDLRQDFNMMEQRKRVTPDLAKSVSQNDLAIFLLFGNHDTVR